LHALRRFVSDELIKYNSKSLSAFRFPILKRTFKASMPVFEGSALQQASGTPTASSVAASRIADSLVPRRRKKGAQIPADVLELGRSIGLNHLCWMRPPKSRENFAHLCVVTQAGQGEES
jgi:hypothetical protein